MRFFKNTMPDYVPGIEVTIDKEFWKETIISTVNSVILKSCQPSPRNCNGGLYVGCAGISYMLYYLSKSDFMSSHKEELLKNAKLYADSCYSFSESRRSQADEVSFLLGNAGIFAICSAVNNKCGNEDDAIKYCNEYASLAPILMPIDFFPHGSDELLVGRAGYLCGAHFLNGTFQRNVVSQEDIIRMCNSVIESGKTYVKKHKLGPQCPLMYSYYQSETLGAAHGLCGILQMLLNFPFFYKSDPSIEKIIKDSVDFMLGLRQPNGNIATAMDEVGSNTRPESEELVHWCHGAPGFVYLLAKAYIVWKDEKYLNACISCGDLVWQKGLLKKGPGICHGVAGNGYVFLLLYRLTNEAKYLHRAHMFAKFILSDEFQKEGRTPDYPNSLYEGLAGTMCFFVDLLQPEKAEFPFFNVF